MTIVPFYRFSTVGAFLLSFDCPFNAFIAEYMATVSDHYMTAIFFKLLDSFHTYRTVNNVL